MTTAPCHHHHPSLKRTGKIAKTGKGKGKGLEADAGPSLVPEIEAAEGTVAAVETVTGQTAEIDGMTGTGETGIGTGTVIGAVSVSVMIGITIGEAGVGSAHRMLSVFNARKSKSLKTWSALCAPSW